MVFAFGDADTHRAKEWERERGSECCDPSAVRSADSCPLFDLSANLLPLPVELHDVLQLHARRARCLDRRLAGEKRKEKKYTIRGKKTVLDLNKHRFHTYRLKDYNTNTLKAIQIPVEYFIQ